MTRGGGVNLNDLTHEEAAIERGLRGARRWLAGNPAESDPRTAMAREFIAKHEANDDKDMTYAQRLGWNR
jgi:hypothetical protein